MNNEFYFPLKKEQLLEKPSDNRFWVNYNNLGHTSNKHRRSQC